MDSRKRRRRLEVTPGLQRAGRHGRATVWALIGCLLVVGVAAVAAATRQRWLRHVQHPGTNAEAEEPCGDAHDQVSVAEDAHAGHAHAAASPSKTVAEDAHAGHAHGAEASRDEAPCDEAPASGTGASTVVSKQGRKNIGLTLHRVTLGEFEKTASIPASVVGRPGQSERVVSAPMTGTVERIYLIRGEAVAPGEPLFDLRLTHEDLVSKQSELLESVETRDVIQQDVARYEKITADGAIATKHLLERRYEEQKIEGIIRAQRQTLLLHGMTEEQIESIIEDRRLLASLTVYAPELDDVTTCGGHELYLQMAELSIQPGEHVVTGTRLCELRDHCELYVEGRAFERDAGALTRAANGKFLVTALIEDSDTKKREVSGLRILYVESEVDVRSRALKFYVSLPNELVRNEKTPQGHHFITWRYRPGQQVELLVPVQRWVDRIVLPIDAVVQDGIEWYVYRENGDRFDRLSVHVEYRDQQFAVIDNDGTVRPGDTIAVKGTYQIHLESKKAAGGGVDPHAGHHH